ncbi:hypothetical protein P7C70_g4352, partial [Phenoliferia sp. Uapishka_3]
MSDRKVEEKYLHYAAGLQAKAERSRGSEGPLRHIVLRLRRQRELRAYDVVGGAIGSEPVSFADELTVAQVLTDLHFETHKDRYVSQHKGVTYHHSINKSRLHFAKSTPPKNPSNLTRLLRDSPPPTPVASGSQTTDANDVDHNLAEVVHSMDLSSEIEQPSNAVCELRELAKARRMIRLQNSKKLDRTRRVKRALRKAKEERDDELMRVHWMEKPLDKTRGQRRRALELYRGIF